MNMGKKRNATNFVNIDMVNEIGDRYGFLRIR